MPEERRPESSSIVKVLVVDDDHIVLRAATAILSRAGFQVVAVQDAVEGLTAVRDPTIDIACLDINMPNLSGLDLLKAFKQCRPDVEVIMMTAFGTISSAVAAVKAGAYDFLTKPFENIDVLTLSVERAAEKKRLRERERNLEATISARESFADIIGQSHRMRTVFKLVETVSYSTATVLIRGETGTGKELVARAIHFSSPRKAKPFVTVNCSALTDTLLDSELFGHVKGAFTGASSTKSGLFESADGGSIFLDEIGDISPQTQVRLLRVLQEGEVKRVGGTESTTVDVRVIAATNVDLAKARDAGKFREDLYYRLNVITVDLPALRERPSDIPLLAQHFLGIYAAKSNKRLHGITSAAMSALTAAYWRGNVRELENVIERAVVLSQRDVIDVEELPPDVLVGRRNTEEVETSTLIDLDYMHAKQLASRSFDRRYIATLLERSHGNTAAAARTAGVDRSNFRRMAKHCGLTGHAVQFSRNGEDDAD